MSWTEHYTKIKKISQLNVCLIVLFEVEKGFVFDILFCRTIQFSLHFLLSVIL